MLARAVLLCALTACGRVGFDDLAPAGGDDAGPDVGSLPQNMWLQQTTQANAPAGRFWHTGVWTGLELIVFGGTTANATNHVNTGGRYNPATDTWTATSTGANVPSTRSWHTAIWTGTRMIIWGGRGSTNTGASYDPGTDTWTPTSMTNVPSARFDHTAVWTGSKMIVWGGYYCGNTSGVYCNDGGVYDPATNSWAATMSTAGAPSARNGHIAVWTGSTMLVWGGSNGGTWFGDGASYMPANDTWAPISTTGAPAGRDQFRAFWTGSKLLVWGGQLSNGTGTNTGGLYDPATDSWTATSQVGAPDPRRQYSAVWTGSKMIVWAGYVTGVVDSGGIYDPASNTWTTLNATGAPPGAGEPLGPSSVWTGTSMIVWGGDGPNSGENTGGVFAP